MNHQILSNVHDLFKGELVETLSKYQDFELDNSVLSTIYSDFTLAGKKDGNAILEDDMGMPRYEPLHELSADDLLYLLNEAENI